MTKREELEIEYRVLDELSDETWGIILNAEHYGERAREAYQVLMYVHRRLRLVKEQIDGGKEADNA